MNLYLFKLAFRHIFHQRYFSAISIIGFVVAFTCSVAIFKYVSYERSFDQHLVDINQLFRLETDNSVMFPATIAEVIKDKIPMASSVCVTQPRYTHSVSTMDGKSKVTGDFYQTDKAWITFMQPQVIIGDINKALSLPSYIALNKKTAEKLFGTIDIIDKTVIINHVFQANTECKVAAVYNDVRPNTSIAPDGLYHVDNTEFLDQSIYTLFIKLDSSQSTDKAELLINSMLLQEGLSTQDNPVHLKSFDTLHFSAPKEYDYVLKTNKTYVDIFFIVGLVLIFISIINFHNFRVGNYKSRIKSFLVLKMHGAQKVNINSIYIIENFLICGFSSVLSFFFYQLLVRHAFIPLVEETFFNDSIPTGLLLLMVIIGTIFLISILPSRSLFNQVNKNISQSGVIVQKTMISLQFIVTIVLLVSVVITYQQNNLLLNSDKGLQVHNIISSQLNTGIMRDKNAMVKDLTDHPQITDVTFASNEPEKIEFTNSIVDEQELHYGFWAVDHNFIHFFNIKILDGRGFSNKLQRDEYNYVFNKAAIAKYDLKDKVGQSINGLMGKKLIGVCDDFNYASLHQNVEPLCLICSNNALSCVFIKYTGNASTVLKHLEKISNKYAPNDGFNYSFLDETFKDYYKNELKIFTLTSIFSIIALFVTLIGTIGLVSIVIQQHTKEIGIRKVNGANSFSIMKYLNYKISIPILYGFLVSIPLIWYLMRHWLLNFIEQVPIHWYYYPITGFSVWLLVTLVSSMQISYAASQNPVKALRYE